MKNRIIIPVILLLSFMMSSFQQMPATSPVPDPVFTSRPVQQNSCYWITSLIHNGEEISKNYDRHIFCFHPDGTAEFCNDLFCEQGTWKGDADIMEIFINAESLKKETAGSLYEWLNGTWKVLERTESTLVLEKIDKDYWRVSFITNGR